MLQNVPWVSLPTTRSGPIFFIGDYAREGCVRSTLGRQRGHLVELNKSAAVVYGQLAK